MPFVTYIPLRNAKLLKKPVNLISIRDRWDWPEFSVKHNRLDLCFSTRLQDNDPNGFNEQLADKVFEFVMSCGDQDIYVHCGEGRMRSPAVAAAIGRIFGHKLDESVSGCIQHTGSMERWTYHVLRKRAVELGIHK